MSSLSKDQLLKLMCANLEHARHVENERLTFTSIYIAIVTGFFAFVFSSEKQTIIIIISLCFLLIISFIGLLFTNRWSNVFDGHMKKAKELALLIYGNDTDNIKDREYAITIEDGEYKEPPFNTYYYFKNDCKYINELRKEKKFGFYIHTKNLFKIFYCTVIIAVIVFLINNLLKLNV